MHERQISFECLLEAQLKHIKTHFFHYLQLCTRQGKQGGFESSTVRPTSMELAIVCKKISFASYEICY